MFQFFFKETPQASTFSRPPWCGDPLQHPLLRDMSQRDLADLPFSPEQPPEKYGRLEEASRPDLCP